MIIRIRTNIGVWRVEDLDPSTATTADVLTSITKTRPHVVYEKQLSSDPKCENLLDTTKLLSSQGLGHGSMIYCKVDASTCAENIVAADSADGSSAMDISSSTEKVGSAASATNSGGGNTKRIIDKDGSIKLVHAEGPSQNSDKGFRKGQLALRDMKMAWTLQEFTAMNDKYDFKIKRQDSSFVGKGGLHLESSAVNDFQSYLRRFQFQQQRFGYLYGKFVDDEDEEVKEEKKDDKVTREGWGARMPEMEDKKVPKNAKVVVEAIYEPPQEADPESAEGFVILDDPNEENVENLAKMLGLQRVGWIVGHPPREEGFQLSAAEVIMAAELQLESAGGIEPTPFVTVRVTVDDDGNVVVEAFQVSLQCMEMVAEEALDVGPNPGFCYVNDTFTAIQEGKASATVENNFFLTLVPIHGYQSDMFVTQFPFVNRPFDDRQQTHDEMKRQLTKSGQAGWTFIDLLSDFALLLYLCKFLDVSQDMPKICESVKDREVLLDDGYKIIITSLAGMDGSY